MNKELAEKVRIFDGINEISLKREIVFLGTKEMVNFPFYELINRCNLEYAIYNRSIENVSTKEAYENLDVCVLDIMPKKVFLALDYKNDEDISYLKKIIEKIISKSKDTDIYLVSTSNIGSKETNRDISYSYKGKVKCVDLINNKDNLTGTFKSYFKQLTTYFRDRPITLQEAFDISNI